MISWSDKVNSVQEACTKCFAVPILKFEILQTTWKNKTKNIKMLHLLVKNWKLRVWSSLFHFFYVICKISDFNMWTAKHLAQASCTELTLLFSSFQLTNASKLSLYLQALIQQSKSPGSLFVIHQTLIVLIPMKSALLDILV